MTTKNSKESSHRLAMAEAGGGVSNSPSSEDNDDNNDEQDNSPVLQGRSVLCLVAFLYGTLNVSLRFVFQLPEPPSAAALSAVRGWLASLCFVPLLLVNNKNKTKNSTPATSQEKTSSSITMAGLELAVWNFLAQGLLNIGLLSTGSARASFLTQTSVLLTPLISSVFGQPVPSSVWWGGGVALVGLTLLSGGGGGAGASMMAFSSGDWFVLGGALSWSFYLFRLGKMATNKKNSFNEINLQAIKTMLVAVLYSVWWGWSISTVPIAALWSSLSWMTNLTAWVALFYSALGPGAIADVLQQQSQKHVSASEANIILSMEPVFTALCARVLLGEITTVTETIGGGLILMAALIATR